MNSTAFFFFRLLIFPLLGGLLTFLCLQNDFALRLVGVDLIFFGGLFFVFAITMNTANMRRFNAIEEIAVLWSLAMSFWQTSKRHLPKFEKERLQNELKIFFDKLRFLLHVDVSGKETHERLSDIDNFFNEVSLTINKFRASENFSDPEVACLLGWLEKMYLSFEKLLAIKEHRTPKTLRVFTDWALVIGVLILSPQFAKIGYYGILVSFVIMFYLIILIKIQKILEYPFGKSIDHIDLRMRDKASRRIV